MKKLIAISAMTLMLTTCGVPSQADVKKEIATQQEEVTFNFWDLILEIKEQEAAELRASQMQQRIMELQPYVHNTWYVFAGSTPEGWDCSGLVMWFYSKFNLQLEHSATAQMYSGEHTKEPLPGDVVSFSHVGSEVAYHNGIYIGAGLFIHSPRPGAKTRLSLVDEYMDGNPEVTYTRLDFQTML